MITQKYIKRLNDIGLNPLDIMITSNDHVKIECLICHKNFTATPKSKLANYKRSGLKGCPECTKRQRYEQTRIEMICKINDNGYAIHSTFIDSHTKIKVHNINCDCNRRWESQPFNLVHIPNMCKPCNDDKKRIRMKEYNVIRSDTAIKKLKGFSKYKKSVRVLSEQIYRKNELYFTNDKLERGRNKHHLDHIISIKESFINNIPVNECAHINNLRLVPEKINISKYSKITTKIPNHLTKYFPESEKVTKFKIIVQEHVHVDFIENYELSSSVIHLFNANKKIGIYLSTFDHDTQLVGGYKALKNIYDDSIKAEIRTLIFYEDEWNNSQDIILSKIRHILQCENYDIKLNGRQCIIRKIDKTSKKEFLEQYHIQGNDKSNVNLGAFYVNELVAVMTFANIESYNVNGNKSEINLSRFCTKNGILVRGIASKLFSHYVNNFNPIMIYSLCDLRMHDGKSYDLMGFQSMKITPLTYYYIVNGIRKHKWSYGKTALKRLLGEMFDVTKTEREITLDLGYDRIWDCGKRKYTFDVKRYNLNHNK